MADTIDWTSGESVNGKDEEMIKVSHRNIGWLFTDLDFTEKLAHFVDDVRIHSFLILLFSPTFRMYFLLFFSENCVE